MRSCGIADDVLHWLKSYFDRTQEVKVGENMSLCKSIDTGIGQGNILGPLIFVFYINDMIKNVVELRVNMYAES